MKLLSIYVLSALVLSGFVVFIPVKETSAQGTPQYQDASNGLPTQSLWVSQPRFFDLDNDGSGDLTILGPRKGPGDKSLHVFKWNGNSWTDSSATEGTNNIPHSSYGGYSFGDVDNDGDWDVGVGSHGAQRLDSYLRMPGNSWMRSSQGLQNSEDAWSVDLGDMNSDGNLDMLLGGFWEQQVSVYAGDGSGNWLSASNGLNLARTKQEGRFFDMNNDGDLDVLVGIGDCQDSDEYIYVYKGDGEGNWVDSSNGLPQDGMGAPVTHGDFNNDGLPDIALSYNSFGTKAYLGDGEGNWQDSSAGLPASYYSSVKLADMNNDKYDDLVALTNTDPGYVDLYLASGNGQWAKADTITMEGNAKGWRVGIGDFDHNGHRDIIAGFGTEEDSGSIKVWKETTVPTELDITMSYPDGQEFFRSGSIQFIRWLSAVPDGTGARSVTLELSTSGSNGPWTIIGEGIPDTGFYQWAVPNEASGDCYIRATLEEDGGASASDASDNAFGIDQASSSNHNPTIEILKPSEDEEPADESYTIEWSAEDQDGDEVRINLYYDDDTNPDNGNTFINGELENTGRYNWDCSGVDEGSYYIYGLAEDGRGGSADDYSEGTVKVQHGPGNHNPTMEVQEPEEDKEEADEEFTIKWYANDEDGEDLSISLYYDQDENPDNGKTLIESDLENTGEYDWDCSEVEEGEYSIYGVADDGQGGTAEDHSEGTVLVSHEVPNNPPGLEVTEPDGDDEADKEFSILWEAEDEDEDTLQISLYYDDDTNPDNGKALIADSLENTGSYDWDCSDVGEGDYYIYGVADDGQGGEGADYSSGVLTIDHQGPATNHDPEIDILQPDGDDEADEEFTITWTASDQDEDTLEIALYHDDDTNPGNGKTLISDGLSDTGSYDWDCAGVDEGNYYIFAEVEDGEGGSNSDYSSGALQIDHEDLPPVNQAPEVDISDHEAESVPEGLDIEIWWNATDPDEDSLEVALYYSTEASFDKEAELIEDELPATGSYQGLVELDEDGDYYLYVQADDGKGESATDRSPKIKMVLPVSAPDFAILGIDIDPTEPKAGESVTISVTVKNLGDAPGSGGVKILVDNDQKKLGSLTLAPGQEDTVTVSWLAEEGDHDIEALLTAPADDSDTGNHQETLDITVAGGGGQTQDPGSKDDESEFPAVAVGLGLVLVLAAVGGAFLYKAKMSEDEEDWDEEETECPSCGGEAEYYKEYGDSYCENCEEYLSEMEE